MLSRFAGPRSVDRQYWYWVSVCFLGILLIAGGASRADVSGQLVVRLAAWLVILGAIVAVRRPMPIDRRLGLFFLATAALPALQLIPLPPAVWTALPGRALLTEAANVLGLPQPWRPISISPSATVNALFSLVVPAAVLFLISRLDWGSRIALLPVLLTLILASTVVAVLQFAGSSIASPFINGVDGAVSGTFANRNHFALFAAIGVLLAFGWAFGEDDGRRWRMFAAFGCVILFLLTILGSGSRAGMALGAVAIVLGVAICRKRMGAQFRRLPRGYAVAIVVGIGATLVAALAASIFLGRAVGVDRASELAHAEDLRVLALPTILTMAADYFPIGTGFGTFDPAYRISEPTELLGLLYLNHAHNDWLEILLDGGLASVTLAAVAIVWWARHSWSAWRAAGNGSGLTRRVGSTVLLMIGLASATDYPARTPMIMAVIVIAVAWLAGEQGGSRARTKPEDHRTD